MADRHGLSTVSTKNHLEGVFSYSDAAVKKLAEGRVTAPNTVTFVDDDDSLASYGEDLVLRAAVPITAGADATYTITGTTVGGGALTGTAVMPHHVPQGQSIDVTPSTPAAKFVTVTAIAVSGGAAGDKVEILTVPNVDSLGASQWNLLKYVDSMDINTGPYLRPIPERYDSSDHKKRQRQENKTTVTQRYQNNVDGLAKIEGREVTLLLQVEDDGGGTYTETMIFSQFDASTPLSIPKDGDITVKSEGTFSRRIIFS
jgi:hypothetical protein